MRLNLHYGWVMVVLAVIVLTTHTFAICTFGIFLIPLTTEFGWDRGALSAAYSITLILVGFIGIISGRLSDKYGLRILVTIGGLLIGIGFLLMSQVSSLWQVYLIWGLFMGIGSGCCFVPTVSTIPRWFVGSRGIAMGITTVGIGLGVIIAPPLAQWLISSYGWQQAYIILGLITFIVIIPLAQFMKHSPQRVGLRPYGEDSLTVDEQPSASAGGGLSFTQSIKTGRFWLFGLVLSCFFFTVQVIFVHIVPYAVDIGILQMVAAGILSISGATGLIGRGLIGFISDKAGPRPTLVVCTVTLTLSLVWLLFAKEIWMLYLFAVIFGLAHGGMLPLESLVTAELFGLGYIGVILGSLLFFAFVGGALGAPLAGSIFDATGEYSLALLICVVIGFMAIILSGLLLKAERWHSSN